MTRVGLSRRVARRIRSLTVCSPSPSADGGREYKRDGVRQAVAVVEAELGDVRLDRDDPLVRSDRVEAHGAQERRLAGVVVAGDDEVLAGPERRDDELTGRRREHAELDEVGHRHGEVAVPANRQERLGGDAIAGIAAEHGEESGSIGQLEIELRVAGVELDLVGAELAGGPADQVDQLVLVGGNRRPTHSLATDEGHENLVGPIDVDVLDIGIAPQGVQLAEAVDVGHHGIEHGLMGVVRQWRQPAADTSLVVTGELTVDLGDGGDLLRIRRHPRTRRQ